MVSQKTFVSALAGAFLLVVPTAVSLAADYTPPYVPPPVEYSSNWYLRGDIGYKWYSAPDASWNEPGYGDFINESLDNTGVVGGGFGYKWNNYFRTDVTLDYEWAAPFHGNLICPAPCASGTNPDYSDEYADISAWTGMFNAYFDLGNFSGFTPYVGGGVGFSALKTSDVHFVNPDSTTGSWNGATTWNLAWALTAGVSYDFGNNWLLDLNYRYVDLGDAQSAVIPLASGTQSIRYDNITAQEVRLGLRYMIR